MKSKKHSYFWLLLAFLLPVAVLGICWIIEKRPPFLYLFALFGAIVTNYYIGFMVCIICQKTETYKPKFH